MHSFQTIINSSAVTAGCLVGSCSTYRRLGAAAAQAQRLVVGQRRALQPSRAVPLQGPSTQVGPRYRALVMRNARKGRHLLAGFDIRHVQDLVHVQVVVLQLPEQSLRVVRSDDAAAAAAAAEGLGFPLTPIGGGGGRRRLLKAGLIFTGLPWLPQPLALELPVRLRVRSLRLVFEGRHPLHGSELAVDLSQPGWLDDAAAVGGNAAAPVDGRSCRRSRRKFRLAV